MDNCLIPRVIVYSIQKRCVLHIHIPQELTACTLSPWVGQEGSLCSLQTHSAEIISTREVQALLATYNGTLCAQCVLEFNQWLHDVTLEGEVMHYLQLDGSWATTRPQLQPRKITPRTERQRPLRLVTRAY